MQKHHDVYEIPCCFNCGYAKLFDTKVFTVNCEHLPSTTTVFPSNICEHYKSTANDVIDSARVEIKKQEVFYANNTKEKRDELKVIMKIKYAK